MIIGVMVVVLLTLSSRGASTPPFLYKGDEVTRKVTESVTTRSQSGLYLYLPILHIFL
jgi:hypothetical protein